MDGMWEPLKIHGVMGEICGQNEGFVSAVVFRGRANVEEVNAMGCKGALMGQIYIK